MLHLNRILKSVPTGSFLLLVILVFLSSTVAGLGRVVQRDYHHVKRHLTWKDAQSYCRDRYDDLATIYTEADSDDLHLDSYDAWIGLHRCPTSTFSWCWSNGKDYWWSDTNWGHNSAYHSHKCAHVSYSNERIYSSDCSTYYFLICHKYHGQYHYEFIPQSMMWSEALQYCEDNYDDLAYMPNSAPASAVEKQDFPIWIGLHRDAGEAFKWSTGLSEYENWITGEPKDDEDDCVTISSSSKNMDARNCSDRFPFICINENLLLVKENKTWEEALDHCRSISHHDLVSVQLGEEYDYVMQKIIEADTEEVWTGLRFLAGSWLWVNGADMTYPGLPLCPVDFQHCGSISKNYTEDFQTRDCTETRNFLCYERR